MCPAAIARSWFLSFCYRCWCLRILRCQRCTKTLSCSCDRTLASSLSHDRMVVLADFENTAMPTSHAIVIASWSPHFHVRNSEKAMSAETLFDPTDVLYHSIPVILSVQLPCPDIRLVNFVSTIFHLQRAKQYIQPRSFCSSISSMYSRHAADSHVLCPLSDSSDGHTVRIMRTKVINRGIVSPLSYGQFLHVSDYRKRQRVDWKCVPYLYLGTKTVLNCLTLGGRGGSFIHQSS